MTQRSSPSDARRGAIAPFSALLLVVLFAMAAFAVDIGRIVVARSEAQIAADSAAMAGMAKLAERLKIASIGQCTAIQTNEDLALAREEAKTFARKNRIAYQNTELQDADIEIGYMANPYDQSSDTLDTSGWPARPYNAVRVTVRRDENHESGPLSLYFGPIVGTKQTNVGATATAVVAMGAIRPRGNQGGQRGGLLPFTYQVDQWNALLAANGPGTVTAANGDSVTITDNFETDPQKTGPSAVKSGTDHRLEVNMFPDGITSGNFGTINFSKSKTGNSTDGLRDLIQYGPNEADWPDLADIVAADAAHPVDVNGDPGVSAGMESAVEAIVGEPHIIMLYSTVSDDGNNTYYQIVGFAPVTIVEVNLSGDSKSIKIQPDVISVKSAVSGAEQIYFDVTPDASPNRLFLGSRSLVR